MQLQPPPTPLASARGSEAAAPGNAAVPARLTRQGTQQRRAKGQQAPSIDPETTNLWKFLQDEDFEGAEILLMQDSGTEAAHIQLRDPIFGWSPLLFAASGGAASLCKVLLDAKAKSDIVCNEGNTGLILSSRQGHLQVVELLISRRASLDLQNKNGWTALSAAAMNGHEEIGTTLIAAHADYLLSDTEGRTPCMWAARHGHINIVEAILAFGVNLNMEDHDGRTVMDHAQEHTELRSFIAASLELNSRIVEAAQRNDFEAVAAAIEAGANVNVRDDSGWTPVMWAALHGDLDLVALLTRQGASPVLLDEHGFSIEELAPQDAAVAEALEIVLGSNTRMMEAARAGDWERVDEELRVGAYIHQRDDEKRTPIIWAARLAEPEAVRQLHSKSGDLNDRDLYGWTPLHSAIEAESAETVSLLHHLGADFGLRTYQGDTTLHLAARVGSAVIVQLILASDAVDLEELDLDGHTPLQLGIIWGAAHAVSTLLQYTADISKKDDLHNSCGVLSLAVINGRNETCAIMVSPLEKPPPIPGVASPQDQGADDKGKTNKAKKNLRGGKTQLSLATVQADNSPLNSTIGSSANLALQAINEDEVSSQSVQSPGSPPGPLLKRKDTLGASQLNSDSPPRGAGGSPARDSSGGQSPGAAAGTSSTSTVAYSSQGGDSTTASDMKQGSKTFKRSQTTRTGGRRSIDASNAPSARDAPNRSATTVSQAAAKRGAAPRKTLAERRAKVAKREAHCVGDTEFALLERAANVRNSMLKKPPPVVQSKLLHEKDVTGASPLHLAVQFRQETVFLLLLEAKAEVNAHDLAGNTPLHLTVELGKQDMVQDLLAQGAVPASANKQGVVPKQLTDDAVIQELLDKAEVRRYMQFLPDSKAKPFEAPVPVKRSPFRVRVESLPVVISEDDLREQVKNFFRRLDAYNISRIEVPEDPITSKPSGFAYVEFGDAASLDCAMKGQGGLICGNSVRIFKDNILLKAAAL
mmetsp:Transcript_19052/g.44444  ORF Transcript_19052/g.44444 Transcript_19052/m.44444 type:complete len:983 (-) Transcript_19052:63-3011(-)